MATHQSDKVDAGIQAKETNQHVIAVHAEFELTAALADNDVIEMVKVPKGAQILEIILGANDLDSATTVVIDVGDGDDPDRFIDGATIGQAGGSARLGSGVAAATNDEAFGYVYTADDTIDVTIEAGPTTASSGFITLTVLYHCDA